jgi:hypothetical protein
LMDAERAGGTARCAISGETRDRDC